MAILFYHDINEDGHVAISGGVVAGQHTPERHYQQKGHFLEVSPPDHAREHDVNELQGLGYRLATLTEQNAFVKQQKKTGALEE